MSKVENIKIGYDLFGVVSTIPSGWLHTIKLKLNPIKTLDTHIPTCSVNYKPFETIEVYTEDNRCVSGNCADYTIVSSLCDEKHTQLVDEWLLNNHIGPMRIRHSKEKLLTFKEIARYKMDIIKHDNLTIFFEDNKHVYAYMVYFALFDKDYSDLKFTLCKCVPNNTTNTQVFIYNVLSEHLRQHYNSSAVSEDYLKDNTFIGLLRSEYYQESIDITPNITVKFERTDDLSYILKLSNRIAKECVG